MALKNIFKPKQQTAIRGRSSALVVTVVLHAVIFLISGAIIVSKVYVKPEAEFVAEKVVRARIPPKKLQVPVKITKSAKSAPKINSARSADSRPKLNSVDLTGMPTGGGTGRGIGVDVSGVSLGDMSFGTSQISIFGKSKGKGEKFFFALDTSQMVLIDAIGGIDAYKLIKAELIDAVGRLSPAVLFNVAVFEADSTTAFSKDLVLATDENIKKLTAWLAPLNNSKEKWGPKTLGKGGVKLGFTPMMPIFNSQETYITAIEYSIQKGVDTLFWLGSDDSLDWLHKDFYDAAKSGKPLGGEDGCYPFELDFSKYSGGKEAWDKLVMKARAEHAAQNKDRLARGEAIRVIEGNQTDGAYVSAYFPAAPKPPNLDAGKTRYGYTSYDILDYMESAKKKYTQKDALSALGLKKKKFTINVIHFVPKVAGAGADDGREEVRFELDRIKEVSAKTGGSYTRIEGLDAIKSASSQ